MKFPVALSISLATASLALGYALSRFWLGSIGVGLIGLLWLVAYGRAWPGSTHLALVALAGFAAGGAWLGVAAGWMLVGLVTALIAWDLSRFSHRLQQAAQIEHAEQFQRAHLQRLLVVSGMGLLLGGLALTIQVSLNLGGAILLGLLVIIGLGRVVSMIR